MKRFWKSADVVEGEDAYGILLDSRPVKTPARADLAVPTRALADAIAAEWNECDNEVDPRAMPLTGLANAAIDRIGPAMRQHAEGLARYGESDLTCYRADSPEMLVRWQEESWDALLAWARRRYDVDFVTCSGVMHVAQPDDTVRKLAQSVAALDSFELAGLTPLVTIGGSRIAALALCARMVPAEAAWDAVSLDDRLHLEQWGDDKEARAALDARRRDFMAAARFLELLSSDAR